MSRKREPRYDLSKLPERVVYGKPKSERARLVSKLCSYRIGDGLWVVENYVLQRQHFRHSTEWSVKHRITQTIAKKGLTFIEALRWIDAHGEKLPEGAG